LHTGFTTNAQPGVKFDDAVMALVHSRDRANADARRIGAVIAARDLEITPVVGESPLFDIFDPGPVDPKGHLIFRFAGYATGMAANAFTMID